MNNNTLVTILLVVLVAGLIGYLVMTARRGKAEREKANLQMKVRIEELTIGGMDRAAAEEQVVNEARTKFQQQQRKNSLIMGPLWIMFGIVFGVTGGFDIFSYLLIGLGVVQLGSALYKSLPKP